MCIYLQSGYYDTVSPGHAGYRICRLMHISGTKMYNCGLSNVVWDVNGNTLEMLTHIFHHDLDAVITRNRKENNHILYFKLSYKESCVSESLVFGKGSHSLIQTCLKYSLTENSLVAGGQNSASAPHQGFYLPLIVAPLCSQ